VPAERTFIGAAVLVTALVSHSPWKFSRVRGQENRHGPPPVV